MSDSVSFNHLEDALKTAGRLVLSRFGEASDATIKSAPADYRTEADVDAERVIADAVREHYPEFGILGEEGSTDKTDAECMIVIDPIDGTNNFVLGIPVFCCALALTKRDQILYGAIYDPVNDHMYTAKKGEGAFQNGARLSVNSEDRSLHSTIAYCCDYTTPVERQARLRSHLINLCPKRVLDLWSPTFLYCALARGAIEAVLDEGDEVYDFAAGRLIAYEAGARFSSLGDESTSLLDTPLLMTNGTDLHGFLVQKVAEITPS